MKLLKTFYQQIHFLGLLENIKISMQKWEEEHRQKHHELKIENAKSSLKKYSKSKDRNQSSAGSSRKKNTPTTSTPAPVKKILQIFHMQQYGPLLAAYNFPGQLSRRKSTEYIDQMLDQVAEKDKQMFLSLLNTLTIMSQEIPKSTTSRSKKSSNSKSKKTKYPPTKKMSSFYTNRNSTEERSEKTSIKFRVKQKSTIVSTGESRHNLAKINLQVDSTRKSVHRKQHQANSRNKNRKKSMTVCYSKATADDSCLVHDFTLLDAETGRSGVIKPIKESNQLLNRLFMKLQQLDPSPPTRPNNQEVNLEMEKIKNMYLSFDSATLTSNIINIDLREMIECLAMEIRYLIAEGEVSKVAKDNANKIKDLLQQSFVLLQEKSRKSESPRQNKYLEDNFGSSMGDSIMNSVDNNSLNNGLDNCSAKMQSSFKLKSKLSALGSDKSEGEVEEQSPAPTNIKKFQNMRDIDFNNQEEQNIEEQIETDKSSETHSEENLLDSNCSINMRQAMQESSIWGNSCIGSVVNDFTCFDNIYDSMLYGQAPQYQDIRNFIELVVMSGKMEKEVPIIAYIYLRRLLEATATKQAKVTNKNWRNLVLICLIEASKIWDDQSLENHSFSQIIQPYSTLQINRLQKYLVYFLDYRLTIQQKEYSEGYFKLRRHVGQKRSSKTAGAIRLDLRTIQKLQQSACQGPNGSQSKSISSKQQMLKRLLNKSF